MSQARENELEDLNDWRASPGPAQYAGIYINSSFSQYKKIPKKERRYQRISMGKPR